MTTKVVRRMDIQFVGIDSWNRPVYKEVGMKVYFGSVISLFPDDASENEVNEYFKDNIEELEFFGNNFDCEPHGGRADNWEFTIINN